MENLKVCYKECVLGELGFVDGQYVYVPNEQGVKSALKKNYPIFLYNAETSFMSEVLPEPWQSLVISNEQQNRMIVFGINETDNDFERLLKVAKTDCHRPEFHFEII